ncbi:MAG: PQQ-binding-like beta-propeller repeat protein [Phycisphaerales bacterium]|nr:PQQ-binding-like beta-propeller repeat protein [Phycisphaerales bacterium]
MRRRGRAEAAVNGGAAMVMGAVLALTGAASAAWTHLAGTPARVAVVDEAGAALASAAWSLSQTEDGHAIAWVSHAAPVVWEGLVCAVGRIEGQAYVIAVRRSDGGIAWTGAIPAPFLDSWSSPAVDGGHGQVVMASGSEVRAFDAATGSLAWTCGLGRSVVNASPLITTDRGGRDRLFITDYDGYLLFGGGRLYCVNIDARDGALNPWDPGDIVWSVNLGRATSGNSVAYDGARVYVADGGNFNAGVPGSIRAFDAGASTAPAALWTFSNVIGEGFYGGVSVATVNGVPGVYGASYAFYGGLDSANLVKVNAQTGALVWSVACNRTQSIPVPLGDGRVVLATGIPGFGSVPSLQVFQESGGSAALVLDTATQTWNDDGDGVLETGEYVPMGGWTHQAVVVVDDDATCAYVGTAPLSGGFGAYTDLRLVDLDVAPGSAGFVREQHAAGGGSVAVEGGTVYTVGASGLLAFGAWAAPPAYDVNGDGAIDVRDLLAWEQGMGARDVDGDGTVDGEDRAALIAGLRAGEPLDIIGGGA